MVHSSPDTMLFPQSLQLQTRGFPWCLYHKGPWFQAQNWVPIWEDAKPAAGVFLSYPSGAWNASETEEFTPLKRGAEARETSGLAQQVPPPQSPAN